MTSWSTVPRSRFSTARIRAKCFTAAKKPIFAPEKEWEKVGQVPNVVFVEGMVQRGDRYLFYYGGADKYVGVAEATQIH